MGFNYGNSIYGCHLFSLIYSVLTRRNRRVNKKQVRYEVAVHTLQEGDTVDR